MDTSKIDVNVHPAKLEIRFSEEQKVFKAVYHAIKESLLKANLVMDAGDIGEEVTDVGQESAKENPFLVAEVVLQKPEQSEIKIETPSEETVEAPSEVQNEIPSEDVKPADSSFSDQATTVIGPIVPTAGETVGGAIPVPDATNHIEALYNKKNLELFGIKYETNTEEKAMEETATYDLEELKVDINNTKEDKEDSNVTKTSSDTTEDKIEEGEPSPVEELSVEEQIQATTHKFSDMYKKTFGKLLPKPETAKFEEVEEVSVETLKQVENISLFQNEKTSSIPSYKYVGALFSTYIVIEIESEIYIIDQHAAHERIMYEKVKKNFYNDEEKDSQIMLLPDIITLTHKEKSIVVENVDLFAKAGFTFEEFGENTIRLIGVPTICLDLETKEMFKEILDQVNTVPLTALQEKEEKFINTIACKAAVKANMKLTEEEVKDLMNGLLLLKNPFTCPHGRPTAIRMDRADVEKKFGRR